MYNSSLTGKRELDDNLEEFVEIPEKVFFNDMSQVYMQDAFRSCDVVYSGIAWQHGYKFFNERSGNVPAPWKNYIQNVNKCVEELGVPAFITGGVSMRKYFPKSTMHECNITHRGKLISDSSIFVWNYEWSDEIKTTEALIDVLCKKFHKCLDFSCGYGEHLLKFEDFVACDIDKKCLAYLARRCMEGKR